MTDTTDNTIRVVDMFCGGGGLSWGLVEGLKEEAVDAPQPTEELLEERIELVGINHDRKALDTHAANHPWARHYHDDVEDVDPSEIFDEQNPDVEILSGGIECTHWSSARGGAPVEEQKRMSANRVIEFLSALKPRFMLIENVKEFTSWGEPNEDGTPSRSGERFQAWIDDVHAEGYSVDWKVLNAANYGDPTSRERLIIVARREGKPTFPEPTHSEDGHGDTKSWRTASEIIDWDDPGQSIWERGVNNSKKPLKHTTMSRVAEGVRRYCDDSLEPFADFLDGLTRDEVRELQERPVPAAHAGEMMERHCEPFLGKYDGTSAAEPVDSPLDTTTAGGEKFGLATPYVLGQHSNSVARAVDDSPLPTIATRGAISLLNADPFILGQHSGAVPRKATDEPLNTITTTGAIQMLNPDPFVLPRNGRQRGLHSNPAYDPSEEPLHTVTAKNHDGHLVESYLVPFYSERDGQRPRTHDLDSPLPTVTATGSQPGLIQPFIDEFYGQGTPNSIHEPADGDHQRPVRARDSQVLPLRDRHTVQDAQSERARGRSRLSAPI
jgi:DNA (cytosine-5)-methyltransferase 1